MKTEVLCPAGIDVHPVLSRNSLDVLCRVQGGLRPATDVDGAPVVCCDQYVKCRIWQHHKEIECGPSTKKQRDGANHGERSHTLSNATRDRVAIY